MKLRNRYVTQTASRRWRPGRQPACLQTPPGQDAYLRKIQVAMGDGRPRDAAAGVRDAADRLRLALIFPSLLPVLLSSAPQRAHSGESKAGVSGDPRRARGAARRIVLLILSAHLVVLRCRKHIKANPKQVWAAVGGVCAMLLIVSVLVVKLEFPGHGGLTDSPRSACSYSGTPLNP